MRILYLTSSFPFPLLAGHLRFYHFMRELAARHELTLFSLTRDSFRPDHARAFDGVATEVRTFPRLDENGPLGRILREDLRLFHAVEPAMRAMRAAVMESVRAGRFDAVVLCGKRVLAATGQMNGIPMIGDLCDAESARVSARIRSARLAEIPRLVLGRSLLRSMEQAVVKRAGRTLFASRRDRDAVMRPDDPRAFIVPNGVDAEYWRRTEPRRESARIAFTGAMHYRPNAEAAMRLVREILPLVRRKVPNVELWIVGRDPSAELLAAGREHGVVVTGLVEDIRPFLDQTTVFAAPLRWASGIQNKILEAMAMELPVVTSTPAAEGLHTESGEAPPLVVADSNEDVAGALVHALRNEDRAPLREARRFVEQHFSWRTHALRMESILESAVAEAKNPRRRVDRPAGRSS